MIILKILNLHPKPATALFAGPEQAMHFIVSEMLSAVRNGHVVELHPGKPGLLPTMFTNEPYKIEDVSDQGLPRAA